MTSSNDRHEASLQFQYADQRRARIVAESVRREVGEIDGDRSWATVERDGTTVTTTVAATDLVGLRAGLNTWLGLLDVAERAALTAEGRTTGGDVEDDHSGGSAPRDDARDDGSPAGGSD